MWRVKQIMIDRVANYVVENDETGERRKCDFDCERHAQFFADYLNEKEKNASTNN